MEQKSKAPGWYEKQKKIKIMYRVMLAALPIIMTSYLKSFPIKISTIF